MSVLCIVPCGARKIWDRSPEAGPTPAKSVYIGPFATKCRQYAERFYPSSWCILSAKYGLLMPDDVVPGPYNVTFNNRSTDPIGPEDLARQAAETGLNQCDRIVVLGGRVYSHLAASAFPARPIHAVLDGCPGIGHMMHRLAEALVSDVPL